MIVSVEDSVLTICSSQQYCQDEQGELTYRLPILKSAVVDDALTKQPAATFGMRVPR
jgi:hypothetical protein